MCHPASVAWSGSLFSRSYECNLPSSFKIVLSSALVYSTHPPVSVYGTVYMRRLFPGNFNPASLNPIIRYKISTSSLFLRFRNINLIPISYAFQPCLRGRLTLPWLTLDRKPWVYGENVSHIFCRYSCQHSLFRYLQHLSRVHLQRPTECFATKSTKK